MMPIVLINNRYGRNAVGGAEQAVARSAHSLEQNNQDVLILSTESFHGFHSLRVHHDPENPQNVFRLAPLNISSYERLGALPFVARFFWHVIDLVNIHSFVMIGVWFRRVRPQAVITHNLMGLGLLIPLAIRFFTRSRWSHVLHDIQLLHPSGLLLWGQQSSRTYRGFLAQYYRALTRRLIGVPHEVIAPSQWLMHEHTQFGFFSTSEKTVVSPLTVLQQKPLAQRVGHSPTQLLFLGQLEAHKGILFLLDALELITDAHLRIVGAGALSPHVEAHCRLDPRCTFEGYREGKALETIWASTDILIVPSLCFENAPTVIVEAIERGIPVVASRSGGIPELIQEGSTGWLFTPGDSQDLVRALAQAIKTKYPHASVGS